MAFNNGFNYLIMITFILTPALLEGISIEWQSSANISSNGYEFSPVNQQALLLLESTADSLISCFKICHLTVYCRIFDFDSSSRRCRIFEGNTSTAGSIIVSSSSQSYVGYVKTNPLYFAAQGHSCSFCQGSRYLTCVNNTCQCQPRTFFDGSICQSQKLLGADCTSNAECRQDLSHICLPRKQCGPASVQTANVVGGYGNGTGGGALNALSYPTGIFIGIDNALYVSDYSNHRVIRLVEGSLMGSIVAGTGISGNSLSQLNRPTGLYVDALLNIYVADSNNYRIMFWPKNSTVGVKVAGSGSGGSTLSTFYVVAGIFVDSQKNIYLCDSNNHRVMKFAPNATNGVIVAGTGVAGSGSYQLNIPYDVYFDEQNSYLYVADFINHRIQRYTVGVSTNGTTVAGGNGAGSGSNQLSLPYSICVSKLNNAIYIGDSGNNRVQRWSFGAKIGVTIVGDGALVSNSSTSISSSIDIKLSINESFLFVSETYSHTIWRFTLL